MGKRTTIRPCSYRANHRCGALCCTSNILPASIDLQRATEPKLPAASQKRFDFSKLTVVPKQAKLSTPQRDKKALALIKYYFNNLSSEDFQRLVNTLLICKFGEDIRLTPLRGKDGGRDGETAPGHPLFPSTLDVSLPGPINPKEAPRNGRYLFQVKHHRTTDSLPKAIRNRVVKDFEEELKANVLPHKGDEAVNYFILLTNVTSSPSALNKIDDIRREFQASNPNLQADVWWSEHVTALLDIFPQTWRAFPNLFAGNVVPMFAAISEPLASDGATPAAINLALAKHFKRDSQVKFQQIDLQNDIFKLFVDLEVKISGSDSLKKHFITEYCADSQVIPTEDSDGSADQEAQLELLGIEELSAVGFLLVEPKNKGSRLIVEGGPGQGKSTVTQVVAQIHRSLLLKKKINHSVLPTPTKLRVPFRIELRYLAEWVSLNSGSLEQYICEQITSDSGGNTITVTDFHQFSKEARILLIFDGLDEIGSDDLKEKCITLMEEGLERLEEQLKSDLQVIITTRPPAFTNFEERFTDFLRLRVQPMNEPTIEKYVNQWLKAQEVEEENIEQIGRTFQIRSQEAHVRALAQNPMQLSVLLHFIRLKGAAFPSKRAELYKEYFKVVIDRDVAKTPELAGRREIVERLHQFLGYKIHALSEAEKTDGSISYGYLVEIVNDWLKKSGEEDEDATALLKVGEERLGLLVATKGEGKSTHYGYEIQPIREYFAAAYISNQSTGDAHQCFEELVIRPFWREVCLFFAGLRRDNEKNDLIGRLIATDENYESSLIRPGIGILLSLTEEGVFDQPPHLFNQAIRHLLITIDPEERIVCALAADFFTRLSKVIENRKVPKIVEKIESLRYESLRTEDDSLIITTSKLGSKILDTESTRTFIKGISLSNIHEKTLAFIKLLPIAHDSNLVDLTIDSDFWHGVANNIWQQEIWLLNDHLGQAYKLHTPAFLQKGLLAKYASGGNPRSSYRRRRSAMTSEFPVQAKNIDAVWLLMILSDFLESIAFFGTPVTNNNDQTAKSFGIGIIKGDTEIGVHGLDEDLASTCQELIKLKAKILCSILSSEPKEEIRDLLREKRQWIEQRLDAPGLIGQVVAQATRTLLLTIASGEGADHQTVRDFGQRREAISDLIQNDPELKRLAMSAGRYFTDLNSASVVIIEQLLRFLPNSGLLNCKLTGSEDMTSVAEAKMLVGFNEEHPDFSWLDAIPLNYKAVRDLLAGQTGKKLADFLSFVGKANFDSEILFSGQQTRRTRKNAPTAEFHNTAKQFSDQPGVPCGYLTALIAVDSVADADYDMLKKGLRERYDLHRSDPHELLAFSRHHKTLPKTMQRLVNQLAHDLISEDDWPVSSARYAALFLARDESSSLAPLLEQETKLGL
jgi:hypothetical protein